MENSTTNNSILTTILNKVEKVSTDISRILYNTSATEEYTEVSDGNETISTTQSSTLNLLEIVTTQVTTTTTNETATNKSITTTSTSTTTEEPFDEFGPPEGVEYIFVPLGVMIFVIILSAVVLIISRRRKLEHLRHRLMPLYNFEPGEEGEDDWETELLDESLGGRQRRQGYQSMDNEENAELFNH